jgi:DNA-binding winged helix-turn-helix (wHTH) protein
MPNTLRLPDGSHMRHPDVQRVIGYLFEMKCVEVLGFSNIGKSALLRLLAQRDVWTQALGEASRDFLPVYIDCNRMLEMTDQGFYEVVLRCLQESSKELANLPALQTAYATLVQPQNEFQVPLSFSTALRAVMDTTHRKLILLFDEFDEPFSSIESRVFLNLRAKKDRNPDSLAYVTATNRPLAAGRAGQHSGEFVELFAHHSWQLAPLTYADVERYVMAQADMQDLPVTEGDVAFIYEWTGGHPSMMDGLLRLLAAELGKDDQGAGHTPPSTGNPSTGNRDSHWSLHRRLTQQMRDNVTLQRECNKILQGCKSEEMDALMGLYRPKNRLGSEDDGAILDQLEAQHILLSVQGKRRPFSRLLTEAIQLRNSDNVQVSQLMVDVESGAVLVNGETVETLTALEYKLMLLLSKNAEKIVDKYQIVLAVWGEEYLDSVDDARIEKLISRLRQKVEPDHSNPRFITTVRGRGYRLMPDPET